MTQAIDDYLTPHEAADELWALAAALEKHEVPFR
jgi:hypothetical protein